MSFEQRKRVSIGVELAANPSILFLDEPTTGLDSLASQSLIHNLRTIAANGRTIVCTIHQPSTAIFSSFDNLLLLKRGGQVVFFGSLGESASHLTSFFQEIPGVSMIPKNTNPASWMLEVINSNIVLPAAPIPTADSDPADVTMGDRNTVKESPNSDVSKQGESSPHVIDFAVHYRYSVLRQVNLLRLETLASPNDGSKRLHETAKKSGQTRHTFNASYLTQFQLLYQRMALTYWRTPIYSLGRSFTNLLIALIFGSAYPQQKYSTYVAVTSRAAVIFITSLFCAILPMILVIPFMSKERPTFYREQQSKMYSVGVYCSTLFLVEVAPSLFLPLLSDLPLCPPLLIRFHIYCWHLWLSLCRSSLSWASSSSGKSPRSSSGSGSSSVCCTE
jgi:energy-coupling factor transporter ATP-binding protein EcfA2